MVKAPEAKKQGVSRAERTRMRMVNKHRPALSELGSKRKLARLGKKQHKGTSGIVAEHVTRSRALRILQISLKDFRRLCILKGIYPRDPSKRLPGTRNQALYAAKDIAYLQHEPILASFRQTKAFMKKMARHAGRGDDSEVVRLSHARPRYSLDHLVRERYPTFQAALADLDDALTLVHLFAAMPSGVTGREHADMCTRLTREWAFFVAKSRTLSKVFVSIKGMYYRATVRGAALTWLVPHKFSPHIPDEVDFRVMQTFLEFYETLLQFIMFKLYVEDLGLAYPPGISADADDSGAFLRALRPVAVGGASSASLSSVAKDGKPKSALEGKLAKAAAAAAASSALADAAEDDGGNQGAPEPGGEFDDDEQVQALREQERQRDALVNLFRGVHVFLSREVPVESLELCIEAFGGRAMRAEFGDSEQDRAITHVVTDRPVASGVARDAAREYVQPQWIFDCVNAGLLLPVREYAPDATLPPHLSPFVEHDAVNGYVPDRAMELDALKRARAGDGGTVALLSATGALQREDAATSDDSELDEAEDDDDVNVEAPVALPKRPLPEEEDLDVPAQPAAAATKLTAGERDAAAEADFKPSATFQGPVAGFFFKRGPLGAGYYRDEARAVEFSAAQAIKSGVKAERKAETTEGEQMRTIVMSKKARNLHGRMMHSNAKKKEEVDRLKRKRAEL